MNLVNTGLFVFGFFPAHASVDVQKLVFHYPIIVSISVIISFFRVGQRTPPQDSTG